MTDWLTPASAYDRAAAHYDGWKWQDFWRSTEACVIDQWSTPGSGGRVLDIGCGTGWYLEHLDGDYTSAIGIDVSPAMLAYARDRQSADDLIVGDARHLPLVDHSVDTVLCTRMLTHLAEIDTVIAQIDRVLRAGGTLILSDVDAAHDYTCTRLPTAYGHAPVATFKHTRKLIARYLTGIALCEVATVTIANDRRIRDAKMDDATTCGTPPVGWASLWRRPA